MKYVDMHCDTIMQIWEKPELNLFDSDLSINIEKMKKGKSLAQCFALYLPWKHSEKSAYQILNEMHEVFLREMENNKEHIIPFDTIYFQIILDGNTILNGKILGYNFITKKY